MIAMSQFGQRELGEVGVTAHYIPHAIETATFRPSPSDFRKEIGVPADAFLVMVNAANRDKLQRKAWFEMLGAFRMFAARHDDAYIYIHTTLDDPSGISLSRMIAMIGIPPDRVRVVPQLPLRFGFIDQAHLAERYSASDVLLAVSRGEGFGIPVIEAQACGTPVIVSDATAQPELVGAGWTVRTQAAWDPTQLSLFAQPILSSVVESLEAAYAAKGTLTEQAVAFAAQYDADLVYETHWRPTLIALEQSLLAPPSRQAKRAAARKAAKR
jgi:glycosyltransferase involved in cell wall biosynthesis